jgi:leucyl/phenylalanyl-tRNA--protein transferase
MKLTPEVLLRAYASGIFPMAEGRDSAEVFWVEPRMRGVIPLDGFRISRSLRRTIRKGTFTPRVNTDFAGVVRGCADRPETWINPAIFDLYLKLHASGHAHSLEVWEEDALVGGVYGVALGGAFFGESMFSNRTDASKVALAYLVDRLRQGGFRLFDTQFLTPHLASLGAIEITQQAYREMLAAALRVPADFRAPGALPSPHSLLQRSNQTS